MRSLKQEVKDFLPVAIIILFVMLFALADKLWDRPSGVSGKSGEDTTWVWFL